MILGLIVVLDAFDAERQWAHPIRTLLYLHFFSHQLAEELTTEHLLGTKLVSLSRKPRKHKRAVVTGRKHFTVSAGRSVRLSIPLNAKGKALLKRFGKLPVKIMFPPLCQTSRVFRRVWVTAHP